jgi:hypothetical protein
MGVYNFRLTGFFDLEGGTLVFEVHFKQFIEDFSVARLFQFRIPAWLVLLSFHRPLFVT